MHDLEFITAQNCNFYYDIQPGPTTETCNFTNATYLELQCQVSSNLTRDFRIDWHYSPMPPENSTIANSSINQLSLLHESKSDVSLTAVTSTLTITGFNVTGNGFYWCSVSPTDGNIIDTPNPSTIVRIWNRNECNSDQENCDSEIIRLYMQSNWSCTTRCADQGVSLDIIDAQPCPQMSTTERNTCSSTLHAGITSESNLPTTNAINVFVLNITISNTINLNSIPTMIVSNSNPASKNNIWIAIGASTGCVILIFYCTIGVIIMCAMHCRRQEQHKLSSPWSISPFDIIQMNTFTSAPQEKDSIKNRVSKIFFEANISYETTHASISQSNDDTYATIQ